MIREMTLGIIIESTVSEPLAIISLLLCCVICPIQSVSHTSVSVGESCTSLLSSFQAVVGSEAAFGLISLWMTFHLMIGLQGEFLREASVKTVEKCSFAA